MAEPTWRSAYPIDIVEILLTASPRAATLGIDGAGARVNLRLEDPLPLEELCKAFDCTEARIIDQNRDENAQLAYSRYRVELWDDDSCQARLICDEYSPADP
jgi:hypothetical protein